jgi:signal transduction histidine kinase
MLGRWPQASLGLCAATGVMVAPAMAGPVPPWSVALGAALFVICLRAGRLLLRAAPALGTIVLGAAVGVALSALLGRFDADTCSTALALVALTVALPWIVGRSVEQQQALLAATTAQVHLRERTRIAHDMHDTLGHELSLLALRAGALELTPDLDERHRSAIAELRAGAGAATEQLAVIVGVLRGDDPPPLEPATTGIGDVVDRAVQAGLTVELRRDGARQLPSSVERTAVRVVQEALTNAVKHAPGAPVQLRVAVTEESTEITVTNPLTQGPRRGTGTGLVALQERVRLVGGTVRVVSHDDMFEIVATLPHTEDM